MTPATLQACREHALSSYPQEACGLVIHAQGGEQYIPCRNTASTASEHFILPAEDWAEAEDIGPVVALFHSHPDTTAAASEADRVSCETTGIPWVIGGVIRDGERIGMDDVRTIEPVGYRAPMEGRAFSFGVLDCFTLIRDWYLRERQIELPDFERADNFWLRGEDLYMANYAAAGFVKLPEQVPSETGDIILMQILSPVANHAGVYLGDGTFLHHLYGRLSCKDVYGGFWRECTRAVVRRV